MLVIDCLIIYFSHLFFLQCIKCVNSTKNKCTIFTYDDVILSRLFFLTFKLFANLNFCENSVIRTFMLLCYHLNWVYLNHWKVDGSSGKASERWAVRSHVTYGGRSSSRPEKCIFYVAYFGLLRAAPISRTPGLLSWLVSVIIEGTEVLASLLFKVSSADFHHPNSP